MSNFWTFTGFEGMARSKCGELGVFYALLLNNELIAGGGWNGRGFARRTQRN
jgi:hypothetical protein